MDTLYSRYPVHIENSLTGDKEQLAPVSEGRMSVALLYTPMCT